MRNFKNNNYRLLLFLVAVFASCVKDKPIPITQNPIITATAKKVYVINEGPFQSGGNGSVSLYDTETRDVVENYYKAQNNQELGNIAQSLGYFNQHFYIVVNNAHKIIICDKQLKKTGEINGLYSPRYILPITNQKAYVSDLYDNALNIIDLNSNIKTGSIPCPGKTERMVLIYNKVFVTNTDADYLYVINTINDKKEDSIFVGKNASSLVIDKSDKVWVLSAGAKPGQQSRLVKINPTNNKVENEMFFTQSTYPGNLCMNAGKDTLYFLDGGIFRMPITEKVIPVSPFIVHGNKNFYGLGINPNDYSVYAVDVLDYIQRSNIYVFDSKGNSKTQFKAGIISNGFYFE